MRALSSLLALSSTCGVHQDSDQSMPAPFRHTLLSPVLALQGRVGRTGILFCYQNKRSNCCSPPVRLGLMT